MEQLTIDFEKSITSVYSRCTDYVAARVHQQKIAQKVIASDMDLSPSQLSQKLGPTGQSSARFTLDDLESYMFTLDDLESYMTVTGDKEPLKYLIAKHLHTDSQEDLKRQIQDLQRQLARAS